MIRPSLRALAGELGLSVATVSMALRDDVRITPATTIRVKALATERGYHADPVVAEGMSRARRRDFYRETIAWLLDRAPVEQPWISPLFSAVNERCRVLGYRIEHFPVDFDNPASLRRLAQTWSARGIRGVLVGPLNQSLADPDLPWDDFSWVAIGHGLRAPDLHRVGRDYDKDVDHALRILKARGCRRPGFVDVEAVKHLMRLPLLRASLVYYHDRGPKFPDAYHLVDTRRPAVFARWLARNRPDSLVMGIDFTEWSGPFRRLCTDLPQIAIAPPLAAVPGRKRFIPDYARMGNSAVGLLHRLLAEGERGVPEHEQTVMVSSGWGDGR